MAEWIAVIWNSTPQAQGGGHPTVVHYLLFAMVAAVLVLVVMMFCRANTRR